MQLTCNNITFIFSICCFPASLELYHTWSKILNSKLRRCFVMAAPSHQMEVLDMLCIIFYTASCNSSDILGIFGSPWNLSRVENKVLWVWTMLVCTKWVCKQTKPKGLCGWMVSNMNYLPVTTIYNGSVFNTNGLHCIPVHILPLAVCYTLTTNDGLSQCPVRTDSWSLIPSVALLTREL